MTLEVGVVHSVNQGASFLQLQVDQEKTEVLEDAKVLQLLEV